MIAWPDIDQVFLDMDGTLLDLHFDNHFWREHVPLSYARKHRFSVEAAKAELFPRFQRAEGTMNWYCVDYWSDELGLDIAGLKDEIRHLIAIHPHVETFLQAVRRSDRRLMLVTNAHRKSLNLKMERTRLHRYFDDVICTHDYGVPKEDPRFWRRFSSLHHFVAQRTLLVDDSLAVLRTARDYGFGHLLAVFQPDSKDGRRDVAEFEAIESFSELLPGLA